MVFCRPLISWLLGRASCPQPRTQDHSFNPLNELVDIFVGKLASEWAQDSDVLRATHKALISESASNGVLRRRPRQSDNSSSSRLASGRREQSQLNDPSSALVGEMSYTRGPSHRQWPPHFVPNSSEAPDNLPTNRRQRSA